jgi:DNA-directed RNA polymerase subunit RPC12/RpoP
MAQILSGSDRDRCPQCGTANPTLERQWFGRIAGAHSPERPWAVYACTRCGGGVLVKGLDDITGKGEPLIATVFPDPRRVPDDIPERARVYLMQAIESPPEGAAMLACSAVHVMLKEEGYDDGTILERIDKAVADHALPTSVGEWAHAVRSIADDARHTDESRPQLTQEEADQVVKFAETLGTILFVLPTRIAEGKEVAMAIRNAGEVGSDTEAVPGAVTEEVGSSKEVETD